MKTVPKIVPMIRVEFSMNQQQRDFSPFASFCIEMNG